MARRQRQMCIRDRFIEGVFYALFPSKMKNMLKKLDAVADKQLRAGGLVFVIIGFIIIWYSKS